jgi:hypothetical protein
MVHLIAQKVSDILDKAGKLHRTPRTLISKKAFLAEIVVSRRPPSHDTIVSNAPGLALEAAVLDPQARALFKFEHGASKN